MHTELCQPEIAMSITQHSAFATHFKEHVQEYRWKSMSEAVPRVALSMFSSLCYSLTAVFDVVNAVKTL